MEPQPLSRRPHYECGHCMFTARSIQSLELHIRQHEDGNTEIDKGPSVLTLSECQTLDGMVSTSPEETKKENVSEQVEGACSESWTGGAGAICEKVKTNFDSSAENTPCLVSALPRFEVKKSSGLKDPLVAGHASETRHPEVTVATRDSCTSTKQNNPAGASDSVPGSLERLNESCEMTAKVNNPTGNITASICSQHDDISEPCVKSAVSSTSKHSSSVPQASNSFPEQASEASMQMTMAEVYSDPSQTQNSSLHVTPEPAESCPKGKNSFLSKQLTSEVGTPTSTAVTDTPGSLAIEEQVADAQPSAENDGTLSLRIASVTSFAEQVNMLRSSSEVTHLGMELDSLEANAASTSSEPLASFQNCTNDLQKYSMDDSVSYVSSALHTSAPLFIVPDHAIKTEPGMETEPGFQADLWKEALRGTHVTQAHSEEPNIKSSDGWIQYLEARSAVKTEPQIKEESSNSGCNISAASIVEATTSKMNIDSLGVESMPTTMGNTSSETFTCTHNDDRRSHQLETGLHILKPMSSHRSLSDERVLQRPTAATERLAFMMCCPVHGCCYQTTDSLSLGVHLYFQHKQTYKKLYYCAYCKFVSSVLEDVRGHMKSSHQKRNDDEDEDDGMEEEDVVRKAETPMDELENKFSEVKRITEEPQQEEGLEGKNKHGNDACRIEVLRKIDETESAKKQETCQADRAQNLKSLLRSTSVKGLDILGNMVKDHHWISAKTQSGNQAGNEHVQVADAVHHLKNVPQMQSAEQVDTQPLKESAMPNKELLLLQTISQPEATGQALTNERSRTKMSQLSPLVSADLGQRYPCPKCHLFFYDQKQRLLHLFNDHRVFPAANNLSAPQNAPEKKKDKRQSLMNFKCYYCAYLNSDYQDVMEHMNRMHKKMLDNTMTGNSGQNWTPMLLPGQWQHPGKAQQPEPGKSQEQGQADGIRDETRITATVSVIKEEPVDKVISSLTNSENLGEVPMANGNCPAEDTQLKQKQHRNCEEEKLQQSGNEPKTYHMKDEEIKPRVSARGRTIKLRAKICSCSGCMPTPHIKRRTEKISRKETMNPEKDISKFHSNERVKGIEATKGKKREVKKKIAEAPKQAYERRQARKTYQQSGDSNTNAQDGKKQSQSTSGMRTLIPALKDVGDEDLEELPNVHHDHEGVDIDCPLLDWNSDVCDGKEMPLLNPELQSLRKGTSSGSGSPTEDMPELSLERHPRPDKQPQNESADSSSKVSQGHCSMLHSEDSKRSQLRVTVEKEPLRRDHDYSRSRDGVKSLILQLEDNGCGQPSSSKPAARARCCKEDAQVLQGEASSDDVRSSQQFQEPCPTRTLAKTMNDSGLGGTGAVGEQENASALHNETDQDLQGVAADKAPEHSNVLPDICEYAALVSVRSSSDNAKQLEATASDSEPSESAYWGLMLNSNRNKRKCNSSSNYETMKRPAKQALAQSRRKKVSNVVELKLKKTRRSGIKEQVTKADDVKLRMRPVVQLHDIVDALLVGRC